MSDDEKFKNFRAYQFESEQSERKASRRKWSLILILAGSGVGLAYLLSSWSYDPGFPITPHYHPQNELSTRLVIKIYLTLSRAAQRLSRVWGFPFSF